MSYNDESFVLQTMLTCIGNKRKLVNNILDIVKEVSILVSKDKLNIVDGFAGSSVVSRKLSCISDNIYVNDFPTQIVQSMIFLFLCIPLMFF